MMARWNGHVNLAKRSNGRRSHFAAAIRKYGKYAFSHEILEVCYDLEVANLAEECWIEFYDTRNPEKGFNLAKGGQHVPHPIRRNPWDDPEYRKNQSEIQKLKWQDPKSRGQRLAILRSVTNTPEVRAKMSAISKEVHSRPDVKAKERLVHTGVKASEETRAKIAQVRRGTTHSEETRKKISVSACRMWQNDSIRKKIIATKHERCHSKETKAKIGKAVAAVRIESNRNIPDEYKNCRKHGLVPKTDCYENAYKPGRPVYRCKACARYCDQKQKQKRRNFKSEVYAVES